MSDNGSAHLTFRTQPLGPEFGSGIEGQEFFLTLGNFPEQEFSLKTIILTPKINLIQDFGQGVLVWGEIPDSGDFQVTFR